MKPVAEGDVPRLRALREQHAGSEPAFGTTELWLSRCVTRILELAPSVARISAIQIAILLLRETPSTHPVVAAEAWHLDACAERSATCVWHVSRATRRLPVPRREA